MSSHSIAEAQASLPELILRARRGESVVIVEDGAPVAELRPAAPPPADRLAGAASVALVDSLRIRRGRPLSEDGASLVRRMRDEDWP